MIHHVLIEQFRVESRRPAAKRNPAHQLATVDRLGCGQCKRWAVIVVNFICGQGVGSVEPQLAMSLEAAGGERLEPGLVDLLGEQ